MDELVIAGRRFTSRLIVGTGKYKDGAETKAAIEASGAEMVTVAVRRVELDRSEGVAAGLHRPEEVFSAAEYGRLLIRRRRRFARRGWGARWGCRTG